MVQAPGWRCTGNDPAHSLRGDLVPSTRSVRRGRAQMSSTIWCCSRAGPLQRWSCGRPEGATQRDPDPPVRLPLGKSSATEACRALMKGTSLVADRAVVIRLDGPRDYIDHSVRGRTARRCLSGVPGHSWLPIAPRTQNWRPPRRSVSTVLHLRSPSARRGARYRANRSKPARRRLPARTFLGRRRRRQLHG